MPSGRRTSKQKRAEVLRLNALRLTHTVIAIRTGLDWRMVDKIIKEGG